MLVVWQQSLNLSANILLHSIAMRQVALKGKSDQMASDVEMHMKQRYVTELLHAEKVAFISTC